MQSIALASAERKELIVGMKRERKPSRRLRMHIVLLVADGYRPARIARVLYCSRTTVYAVVGRFVREGQKAFDDRRRRGPAPVLIEGSARRMVEDLTEGVSPTERGWLRSRWSCELLALELFKERALVLSRETVRRALHRLGFRWRRPRPVGPTKTQKTNNAKSGRGSKMSFRWWRKRDRSFRTRPGWRPTPKWDSAGCARVLRSD